MDPSQGSTGQEVSSMNVLHYSNLKNHDLPSDFKTEGYRKSFSYSSSSGDTSFQTQQSQYHHMQGRESLPHESHYENDQHPPSEGSSASFFLGRDEGESTE
ncbi:hypothetical protein SK128_005680 [Halocaridina rubra]|uniref:Uncharacterized protein n=1 Tax=Halocaridina rubra TaxID=373956 RepID=A0AAN8X3D8_HALRR